MADILIVDYGVGNLASIRNILKHIGARGVISSDSQQIRSAEKLILPGVGAFDNGMRKLEESGLREVLDAKAREDRVPILGICLGMQLFATGSEEGELPGLGWIDAKTVRFRPSDASIRVPHMGWNHVTTRKASLLFEDMHDEPRFYFVHSYHLECADESDVLCTTKHGYEFASAVERQNLYGAQFHPEKSHKFGMRLLRNFVERI